MSSSHQHSQENHDHSKHEGHDHEDHDHHEHHAQMIEDFKKRFWISIILTIPIMVLAPMIQELLGYELRFQYDRYVQFALSTIVFFYCGFPFLKGLKDEIADRSPGMMTLIALAISVAYFYSSAVVFGLEGKIFFWELASLIAIMLLGHWIEMKSIMGASGAVEELARLLPSTALKLDKNGDTHEVKISELEAGDLVLVKPGEKIPADGIIEKGKSDINESMITGESKPVSKKEGDEVIGGSVNGSSSIQFKIKEDSEGSYLNKVVEMVKSAQETKSKTQNLANKAAAWLFYIALFSGFTTLGVWLWQGKEFDYALERMVTVMIIACPHALGLAMPLVVAISTSVSAKNGLLIRNRTAFENSRKITTIIFDKTGTLTKGNFVVNQIKSTSDEFKDDEILKIAASLEKESEHPIATGILTKHEEKELDFEEISDFENLTGEGIQAKINGKSIKIVSPGYLEENNIELPKDAKNEKAETIVYLLQDKDLIGYISLADEIRDESFEAVKKLKENGLKVIMATGDNEEVAKSVSKELGLDDYYAEVLPEDKQKIIEDLQNKGEIVAMTGDGVNDAPALAKADVGIAVGSGTDVAAETADIILVNSNPMDIVYLLEFGKSTYQKMMQNLFWAAGYNIVAIPMAAGALAFAGIILSPAVGAGLMSLSTIIVALNAQLLKRKMKN
ncbi:copper-translocating P-type ATPase [Marivirga salinae]|uniref:Copper-translocating P-type ATPase n=1 Tax=Marivirga salinarum TaxID=3059078 RepID=A0AA51ND25_9BACT|nr:copper-translocating P-type ATPase [Marivirga sp. BDSF4-3]WMN13054.1 copper-translocating P-type ATPase [Marivirga sp. BDSF4-3]